MEEILADTKKFLSIKEASFGKAAKEEALDNPGSIPGSNHDKPVDEGAQSPDKEVQQELPPNSANDNSGAEEAEKLESGHAMDATETVQDVTKKPMISNDANAKEASAGVNKHAQDLMSLINGAKAEQEKAAEGYGDDDDKKAECEGCDNPECSCKDKDKEAAAKEAAEAGAEEANKQAGEGQQIDLTQEVLAKIACTILSTGEGVAFTESLLQKEAGAQAARDTMEFLNKQAEDAEKQAAYDQGAAHADELINQAIKQAEDARFDEVYQAGRQSVLKVAEAQAASNNGAVDYKALGAQVAQEAVKRAQAEMMGIDPAAMDSGIGADEALAGMAGEGADDEIAPEELEQALALMVQSGELSEEEVAAIMSQVGAAGGAEEAGEAVGAMEDTEIPAEMPVEGMEVAASAAGPQKSFLNALATVRANNSK
jgi:hypothetical protein